MQLAEKYRPQSWDEVAGQPKAVAVAKSAVSRGAVGGRAFWISGKTGGGKSTIAKLIAKEVADEFGTVEMDAGRLNREALDDIRRDMQYKCCSTKHGRCYIFNEAHGMRAEAVRNLLVLLEELPEYVTMIFTTTIAGQETLFEKTDDTMPLISRCLPITLQERDVTKPMAERLLMIAKREQLDGGAAVADCVKILQNCRNSMRAALQEVEAGALIK